MGSDAEKEVVIRLRAISDDLEDALDRVEAQSKSAAKESESAFDAISEGAKGAAIVVTGINQAVELVGKGFSLLKSSILGPLTTFRDLVGASVDLVREFENATSSSTAAGKAITEMDRNLERLRSTLGGAIASTPEFSAAIDVVNDRIDRLIELIANNAPAVVSIFGSVVRVVASAAIESVEKIRFAFTALVGNIEEVIEVAKFFGFFEDPLEEIAQGTRALSNEFLILNDFKFEFLQKSFETVADSLEYMIRTGDQSAESLQRVRDNLASIGESSPTGIFKSDELDAAIVTLDNLILKTAALEEAQLKTATASKELASGFNQISPELSSLMSGLKEDFEKAAARRAAQFAGGGSGVEFSATARVDSSELQRFQAESDRARQSFDVLRQTLEKGVSPKFEGNVDDLVPQFTQIGESIKQIFLSIPDDDLGLAGVFITATDAAKDFLSAFGTAGVGPALEALEIVADDIDKVKDRLPGVSDAFEELREQIASVGEGIADIDGTEVAVTVTTSAGTQGAAAAATVLGKGLEDAADTVAESGIAAQESFERAGNDLSSASGELTSASVQSTAAASSLVQSAQASIDASTAGLSAASAIEVSASRSTEAATSITSAADAFAALLKDGNDAQSSALLTAAGDLRGAANEQKDAAGHLNNAADAISRAADRLGGGAKGQGGGYGGEIGGGGLSDLLRLLEELLATRLYSTTEGRY